MILLNINSNALSLRIQFLINDSERPPQIKRNKFSEHEQKITFWGLEEFLSINITIHSRINARNLCHIYSPMNSIILIKELKY